MRRGVRRHRTGPFMGSPYGPRAEAACFRAMRIGPGRAGTAGFGWPGDIASDKIRFG